jgi:hypothetical protein
MRFPKAVIFAFVLVSLLSSLSFAGPVPANGDYYINYITAAALLFNPVPWVSPPGINDAFITVYATDDFANVYAGAKPACHLTTVLFTNGEHNVLDIDYKSVSGDLAIRFGKSNTLSDVTFKETIVTINFESGPMDVYLPEFTLTNLGDMHFWVASNGSTYFANVTDGEGSAGTPNISAETSITVDGRIAAVPEPVTIAMLGLGGLFLRLRKSD